MRVEISLGFVVSLRPKVAAFGQAGSTRLDCTLVLVSHPAAQMGTDRHARANSKPNSTSKAVRTQAIQYLNQKMEKKSPRLGLCS